MFHLQVVHEENPSPYLLGESVRVLCVWRRRCLRGMTSCSQEKEKGVGRRVVSGVHRFTWSVVFDYFCDDGTCSTRVLSRQPPVHPSFRLCEDSSPTIDF